MIRPFLGLIFTPLEQSFENGAKGQEKSCRGKGVHDLLLSLWFKVHDLLNPYGPWFRVGVQCN